jgi:peptidoglycan hydrolase-like protein with peptidoglycan-binding domain
MYKGFRFGSVDGVVGAATLRAIKDLQQSQGLPQTGAIDAALLDTLTK